MHTYKKRGASPIARSHALKVFALPCPSKPSNAESPTQDVYTHTPTWLYIIGSGIRNYTLRGVLVALFLTDSWKVRSSQSVKTKAFGKRLYMYVSQRWWQHMEGARNMRSIFPWSFTSLRNNANIWFFSFVSKFLNFFSWFSDCVCCFSGWHDVV